VRVLKNKFTIPELLVKNMYTLGTGTAGVFAVAAAASSEGKGGGAKKGGEAVPGNLTR